MNPSLNKKKLQVAFNDEAWAIIESHTEEANRGFEVGTINYSDVINEMILNSKIDLKALQAKRTDWKRSIRFIVAQENSDIDFAIKTLMDLKSRTSKRTSKSVHLSQEVENG